MAPEQLSDYQVVQVVSLMYRTEKDSIRQRCMDVLGHLGK